MSYTNSPLVNYTCKSPNHSGTRNHAIDTITIHCVVGQLSVETLGAIFKTPTRQASCNYGVGSDGRILLCVDEKNRSWCTSSASNDNRAITIEVASDTVHPYAVKPEVMDSLIRLCADICQRNGIYQLLWKADKSLIGDVSKQNLTVHRWFAAKACPGDYLYNSMGDIADTVNAILRTADCGNSTDVLYKVQIGAFSKQSNAEGLRDKAIESGLTAFVTYESNLYKVQVGAFRQRANAEAFMIKLRSMGYSAFIVSARTNTVSFDVSPSVVPYSDPGDPDTNKEKIWNKLLEALGNEFGVAGLMGNIQSESNFMPNNLQNSFEKKLNLSDIEYTKAVDNKSYDNFIHDGAGYGLVQWTFWSLKQDLLTFAIQKGKSIGDLDMQLEFLIEQLSTKYVESVWNRLKEATTVREASNVVLLNFERPKDQGVEVQSRRASFGQDIYAKFSKNLVPEVPAEPKVVSLKFSLGDTVQFLGGVQYANANAASGSEAIQSLAKVTAISGQGLHPYHVRRIDESGSFKSGGVYGWVDESSISQTSTEIVYTVVAGDSLSKIASRFGTTYQLLASYNNIQNVNSIRVGQVIRIPSASAISSPEEHRKSEYEIAKEVLQGKWGNGNIRKAQLEAAGYSYAAVQEVVRQLLSI